MFNFLWLLDLCIVFYPRAGLTNVNLPSSFQALKYWRFRVYLLPVNQMATRRILEGSEHCDIYVPPSIEDQSQMVKNFLRFIETFVNRIKRPNAHKKPRVSSNFIHESCFKLKLVDIAAKKYVLE